MSDVKRLNYFKHQFLDEKDFQDEQAYHIHMRRLHNRVFLRWGVAEGLMVEKKADREVIVRPGIAIDRDGREIVLETEVSRDIATSGSGTHAFVTIAYHESHHDDDRQIGGGVDGYRRTTEAPEVHARRQPPPEEGTLVILARIHLDGSGNIREIDSWGRCHAGPAVRPGAIGAEELAENSVTLDKLAPGSVTEKALSADLKGLSACRGWLRLAFKPLRLPPVRPEGRHVRVLDGEAEDFVSDIAYAYCGPRGARGSMPIPVPPGATKTKAFRLAGNTTGTVMAQLVRTGWNAHENRGESTELLNEMMNEPAFHRHVHIADHLRHLDPALHALALSVTADAESQIWLAAIEFE
ncbi:MAG: hypothetical protein WBW33_15680 [Bryobacteraceae bacterium]